MKLSLHRFLPVACATAVGVLSLVASSHADYNLMLNFSLGAPATNTPTNARTIPGFADVTAPFVGTAVNASISNIAGTGANFTFNNVSSYDTGNNAEPLTTSGFYTFGNETQDHTFTLSGLPVGAQITLYAVNGWDGPGRGGYLTFGSDFTKAVVIGDPGTAPTLANFTQINFTPVVVDATGTVTGTMIGGNGTVTDEGQVGGMIFQVVGGVPEPSTYAMMAFGGVAAAGYVFRRARVCA